MTAFLKISFSFIVVLSIAICLGAQTRPLSAQMADTAMTRIWTDSPNGVGVPPKWIYDYGVILNGMKSLWLTTGDRRYFDFIKRGVDTFVNDDGSIKTYRVDEYNLDQVRMGSAVLMLYRVTGEAKYKKAVDLNAASKKPNPTTAAAAYNQLGQALSKGGDAAGASSAYDEAAKTDPTHAGMYYFNEAATFYNSGKLDEAGAAADKAIAADPNRADAYYIKGQSLIPKATVDPKTQKIVAPPGCVEAYQKYLELAPNGPHAADIEGILTGIGAKVKSSYRAGKK